MILLEIGSHFHHVVVCPHVAQEPNEAPFIKFNKFFGKSYLIEVGMIEEVLYKVVPRYSYDMFFNEGVAIELEIDFIGREDLFQFQSVQPGSICFFYIKVIVVIIVLIYDANTKRFGVSKSTIIYPVDIQIG